MPSSCHYPEWHSKTSNVSVAIFPAAACSLLSMNYCWGHWTTVVVIELLCRVTELIVFPELYIQNTKSGKTELLNLYTGLFWYMATCLSLNLPAVGQICQLSLLQKVISPVRQASYWMLVKTKGFSWAGYHGCKTPSYFIINSIIFFSFFFICLFIL